jgi:hypothetical protein
MVPARNVEPLYEGGFDGVSPGSNCIASASTSNHDLIASGNVGAVKGFVLHAVDAIGLVHAMILRIQALVYPIQALVLGGHWGQCQGDALSATTS